jgi:hypothetical protein
MSILFDKSLETVLMNKLLMKLLMLIKNNKEVLELIVFMFTLSIVDHLTGIVLVSLW